MNCLFLIELLVHMDYWFWLPIIILLGVCGHRYNNSARRVSRVLLPELLWWKTSVRIPNMAMGSRVKLWSHLHSTLFSWTSSPISIFPSGMYVQPPTAHGQSCSKVIFSSSSSDVLSNMSTTWSYIFLLHPNNSIFCGWVSKCEYPSYRSIFHALIQ